MRSLIKSNRIRARTFLSRFISCVAKRELLAGAATRRKGTALLKQKWLRTEIIRADVLSEAEETRAEKTAASARSVLSLYQRFESPSFTHLYTIRDVYALRIMYRIPSVEHRRWSVFEKKKRQLTYLA